MPGIETHYGANDIARRILAALRKAGLDPDQRLTPTEISALDHFHTGGLRASLVLKEKAGIRAGERILDLGAGLAGPARMLAASPGCDVDCLDLSRDYCEAAELLNRITGLEERVRVHCGSALAMPFADHTFDVVWMQNVGMNITDKPQLYREIHRVLKPGGRLAFQEMLAGAVPTSYYPLPWATEPADNALIPAAALGSLLAECGYTQVYFEDVSEAPLPPPPAGSPESGFQAPLSLSVYVDNLGLKADNAARSLAERQIRLYRGVFRTQ
jgi:SAM-dependent methyltransferase